MRTKRPNTRCATSSVKSSSAAQFTRCVTATFLLTHCRAYALSLLKIKIMVAFAISFLKWCAAIIAAAILFIMVSNRAHAQYPDSLYSTMGKRAAEKTSNILIDSAQVPSVFTFNDSSTLYTRALWSVRTDNDGTMFIYIHRKNLRWINDSTAMYVATSRRKQKFNFLLNHSKINEKTIRDYNYRLRRVHSKRPVEQKTKRTKAGS